MFREHQLIPGDLFGFDNGNDYSTASFGMMILKSSVYTEWNRRDGLCACADIPYDDVIPYFGKPLGIMYIGMIEIRFVNRNRDATILAPREYYKFLDENQIIYIPVGCFHDDLNKNRIVRLQESV